MSKVSEFIDIALQLFEERSFGPNNCIPATRITLDVMRRLRVQAFPLSVRFWAFNQRFLELLQETGRQPETPAELDEWRLQGAHGIGTDPSLVLNAESHSWGGHLVPIVQGRLLDLTISQIHRPAKGIIPPSFVWHPVSPRFCAGEEEVGFALERGAVLGYNAVPDDQSYRASPYFRGTSSTSEAVRDILGRLRR